MYPGYTTAVTYCPDEDDDTAVQSAEGAEVCENVHEADDEAAVTIDDVSMLAYSNQAHKEGKYASVSRAMAKGNRKIMVV